MAHSPILYNPDEWEECPPPTHFLAFTTTTRMLLSAITIGLSALFFWILKINGSHTEHETTEKKRQSLCEYMSWYSVRDALQRKSERIQNAIYERTYKSGRRRSSKRPLTAEEQNALICWEREVEQTATERARTSNISVHSDLNIQDHAAEKFRLPQKAFENENAAIDFQSRQQYLANPTDKTLNSTTHIWKNQRRITNEENIGGNIINANMADDARNDNNANNKSELNKEFVVQQMPLSSSDDKKMSTMSEGNREIQYRSQAQYNDEHEQMEKLLLEYETPSVTDKNVIVSTPTECNLSNWHNILLQQQYDRDHVVFEESVPQNYLLQTDARNSYFMENQMPKSKKNEIDNEKKHQPILHIAKQIEQMPMGASKTTVDIIGEATSNLIKTNEVYENNDCIIYDDADDAVTYAPEIQSEEISPDQLSENENTLNLVDNYLDRRASPTSKQNSQHFSYLGKMPTYNISNDVFTPPNNELNQQLLSTPDDFNDRKRPSPPVMIPLHDLKGSMDQQRTQKISKFRHRNFGFIDDSDSVTTSTSKSVHKQSSLMSALGVTSTQEALLKLTSLDELSSAMRRAGLASTNLIFGIDYTASNKYQGEHSFNGLSLHDLPNNNIDNPYQQVIKIMGRTLAPFSGNTGIPLFGFGDLTTGDWSVFPLNAETEDGRCRDLDEVLRIYNMVTPLIDLSGPTNFAPLIYRSISICQKIQDYHILVIIADGQVTNERATRKAIVHACQYPLSIIVVGVGDGPWDMMKLFDESLPKRPWDNFHFVEFHKIMNSKTYYDRTNVNNDEAKALDFAVHSLLEIPDQYQHICKLKLVQTSSIRNATKEDAHVTRIYPKAD